MKVADERIVISRANGEVDEFFNAFFSCFEGNPSLLKHADDLEFTVDSLSPTGKGYLKGFLSDPDAGSLWKIDDPVLINGEPAIPHNYWVRGTLAELDVYKRVYKPQGLSHHPNAQGYDFADGPWVQIKSTKNPNGATGAMTTAIDDLITHSPGASTPLKLHILKKPGTDSATLRTALDNHLDTLTAADKDRIEILIEAYDIGVQ